MEKEITICGCERRNFIDTSMVADIAQELSRGGYCVRVVGDLCELAITEPQELEAIARTTLLACYPRAMESMFQRQGLSPLRVMNLRVSPKSEILRELAAESYRWGSCEQRAECDGAQAECSDSQVGSNSAQAESCNHKSEARSSVMTLNLGGYISDQAPEPSKLLFTREQPINHQAPQPRTMQPAESAIKEAWYPIIDKQRCNECGKCHDFCLFGVYTSQGGCIRVSNPGNCKVNCPACARVCPQRAIIFPKYEKSPINGGLEDEEASLAVDTKALYAGALKMKLEERRTKVSLLKKDK